MNATITDETIAQSIRVSWHAAHRLGNIWHIVADQLQGIADLTLYAVDGADESISLFQDAWFLIDIARAHDDEHNREQLQYIPESLRKQAD